MEPKPIGTDLRDRVIDFVSKGGNDPISFRDAIHEAAHAVELGVPYGDWDREVIHVYVMELQKPDRILSELLARAVEWSACERLEGEDEYDLDSWAFIAFREAVKSDVWLPRPVPEMIRAVRGPESDAILENILTMAEFGLCEG